METISSASPSKNAPEVTARIGWILLLFTTLYICYFSHLGALGFVGPDEPRYAWIARDMVETGDWVTPRLYGRPWFEKPPLYYWGAALSFKLFGVSEGAARLPSAVSALLATLALAWLALRLYEPESARWTLLLLPTTVAMIGFSHAAATDMPFSAMLTIAMIAAAVVLGIVPTLSSSGDPPTELSHSRSSSISLTSSTSLPSSLFGLFLGLAVLAKGPAAIILCGGAVILWALFTKRWRDTFLLLHPAAIAAFGVTALPWYILCARRNPDFLRIFIIEHNFKRYLTAEFQHIQPFWFYLVILLIGVFPWLYWLFAIPRNLFREKVNEARGSLFLTCWLLFPIVFFSASQSKLPGYILPAIPPLTLLMARAITVGSTNRLAAATGTACTGLLFTLAAAVAFAAPRNAHFRTPALPISPLVVAGIVVAGITGLLVAWLAACRRIHAGLLWTVGIVLMLLSVKGSVLRKLDPILSSRPTAQKVLNTTGRDVFTFGIRRAEVYGLSFYLHRELPELLGGVSAPAIVIVSPGRLHDLEDQVFVEEVNSDLPTVQIARVAPLMNHATSGRQP